MKVNVDLVKTMAAEKYRTQKAFAEASGMTQGAVSKIFAGERSGSSFEFLTGIILAFPESDVRSFLIFNESGVENSE